jgi:hypothetical protein
MYGNGASIREPAWSQTRDDRYTAIIAICLTDGDSREWTINAILARTAE